MNRPRPSVGGVSGESAARKWPTELAVLTAVGNVLGHPSTAFEFDKVLAASMKVAGASVGALYVKKAETLEVKNQIGFAEPEQPLLHSIITTNLLRSVAEMNTVVHVPSKAASSEAAICLCDHLHLSSLLIAPASIGKKVYGVLLLGAAAQDTTKWLASSLIPVLRVQLGQAFRLAQAFEKLAASELRYRTLTEHANDAIFILAPDGVVREINHRVTEITGHPAEHFIGRRMTEFAAAGIEIAGTRRYQFEKRDGQTALIDFLDAQVEVRGETLFFSIGRDVTAQVQLQTQSMVADRMVSLGILAAGVAHEINNPLSVVVGNLELARDEAKHLEGVIGTSVQLTRLNKSIREAGEAGERVRQIVKDLKTFSRADEAKSRTPVDLKIVLKSTLRMASNEIKHRARVVEVYDDVPLVDGNEYRLIQLFLNLILNAAQSIEMGRANRNEIRVQTSVDDAQRVVVDITDTGHGIPREMLGRLFTPFVTTKPVGAGTGLGLSICKQIVTDLGGEIRVESQVGVGTKFQVKLLQSKESFIAEVSKPAVPIARRQGRVLIIDDEPAIGELLARMLTPEHDVVVMSTAAEALTLLQAGKRFDVIICDMMMPVITGPEFFTALKKVLPEQASRVIFLTGGAFSDDANEFLENVTNVRVNKPVKMQLLRALINERVAQDQEIARGAGGRSESF